MRVFLAILATLAVAGPASAAVTPDVVFAERSALIGADRECDLFDPVMRRAMEASMWQARGALLRSGWSEARADSLGRRARAEGGRRRCDDPVLKRAAADARAGFSGWTRMMAMRFPGGARSWLARRARDPQWFYMRQDIPHPRVAAFGVRQEGQGAAVAFWLPLAQGETAPGAARLYFRDRVRAPRSAADLPGRTRTGLAALAASRASATTVWATERRTVPAATKNRSAVLFLFPDTVMGQLAALDPREAIEVEVDMGRRPVVFLVEVGDFAAARAFLLAEAK